MSSNRPYVLLTLLTFFLACSTGHDIDNDLASFCEAHTSEAWEDYVAPENVDEYYQEYDRRVNVSVTSSQMKEVVEHLSVYTSSGDLYDEARREIKEVIGRDWECEPYKQFHTLTYTNESRRAAKPVMIKALAHGVFEIDGKQFDSSQQLLEMKSKLQEFVSLGYDGITVLTADASKQDPLIPIFEIGQELKVQYLSIQETDETL